jgi:hypothetical protein
MVSDASSSAEKHETNAGEEVRDKGLPSPAKQQWSQLLLTCACLMMLEHDFT